MDDTQLAVSAARAGAEVVRSWFGRIGDADLKGEVDPVTVADREAEEAILTLIRSNRPTDRVIAEESGGERDAPGRKWIVDPLDGTVNFVNGIPQVGVSVALFDDGAAQVGTVIDVFRGEEFVAELGGGASLNGAPIRVSERELGDAVVATGFPYDRRQRAAEYVAAVKAVIEHVRGLRRFGAATLDLAWVAAGRFDGYWEFGIGPWDIAAGMLLITEAGGVVTNHLGHPAQLSDYSFVAANPHMHEPLRRLVAAASPARPTSNPRL